MALKLQYEKIDDIDETYRPLYEEKDGKFNFKLTEFEGLRTDADITRIQASLVKERNDHKATKDKYKPYDGLGKTHEEIQAVLDKLPELEAAAEGKLDDTKINGIVEARLKGKLSPIERELAAAKTRAEAAEKENGDLKAENTKRLIHDDIRKAAGELKVLDSAVEDILEAYGTRIFERNEQGDVLVRDQVGFTPGISPKAWLTDMMEKKAHWWAPSQGGGGGGSDGGKGPTGKNPWTHDNWNVTEQNAVWRRDQNLAKQLAASAGTSIGGRQPAAKK